MINKKKILRSIISYIPFLRAFLKKNLKKKETSPTYAEYYFSIYKQHMDALKKFNISKGILVEIGPGDTLGVGMCAILDGFSKYIAIDIIEHFTIEKNLAVLNSLKKYYQNHSLFEELLHDIQNNDRNLVSFFKDFGDLEAESVDIIISNAVLEHIIDLENYYRKMFEILKPNGFCSHVIDYGAHEFSKNWYEHLYLSDWAWSFLMHGRMYPINRIPHSYHLKIAKDCGFHIVYEFKNLSEKANPKYLNKNLKKIFTEEDLKTKSAHIILRKY